MILQELVRLYDRLAEDTGESGPVVPPYGFTEERISFAVVITTDGRFVRIDDLRDHEGKKPTPVAMQVPAHGNRTSGIAPYFLCDNAAYVLGLDFKGKPERAVQCFEAARDFHFRMAEDMPQDSPLRAASAFFTTWSPQRTDTLSLPDGIETGWIVFRIDGLQQFIHQHDSAIQRWASAVGESLEDVETGTCLITGISGKLARLQPAIKRIGSKAETSIVTFNLESFWSLGKKRGENAPTSDRAAFQYVAALNYLTANRGKHFLLADSTVVFWAERETEFENLFGFVFSKTTDDDQAAQAIRINLERLRQGKPLDETDPETRFYVLGLSPNSSRLAVRFWIRDTVGVFAKRLAEHLHDSEIEKQYVGEPTVVPIWRFVSESATRYSGSGKSKKVNYGEPNPRLAAELTRSVLTGVAYPAVMLSAYLGRIRADREINRIRMAALKAVINRRRRINNGKEVPVALQEDYPSVGYQLGRLFAALEKAQTLALGDINATIKDRYFGAASSTPGRVFPILMRLSQHHVAKAEHGRWIDRVIGNVMDSVGEFPSHLRLEEQGLFSIGYYHQRNAFYTKKTKSEEDDG